MSKIQVIENCEECKSCYQEPKVCSGYWCEELGRMLRNEEAKGFDPECPIKDSKAPKEALQLLDKLVGLKKPYDECDKEDCCFICDEFERACPICDGYEGFRDNLADNWEELNS